jgi:flagellar biosynthetic protein FliR
MDEFLKLFDLSILYPFLLLLARILSFMAFMPIFSHLSIPIRVKVVFSLYLGFFLYPLIELPTIIDEDLFIIAILSEIALGFIAASLLHIVFASIKVAGELVSYAAALSMAQMFDPGSGTQATLVSRFFDYIVIVVFFATGMHEIMLMGIAKSFEHVQLGAFVAQDYDVVNLLIIELKRMMLFAFSISLPVFFISMSMDMFFGYATRSMPQFSVFVVTFQLKFMLIFFVMTYIIAILVDKFKVYFLDTMFIHNGF